MLKEILFLLGSIAVFLSGLKLLSEGVGNLSGKKMQTAIRAVAGNRCGAVLAGGVATAIAQSSIATNMIVIGLVEGGVMSFLQASAAIMGTNVGTTVTAQLLSFSSYGGFDITAAGFGAAFLGVLLSFFKNQKVNFAGGALCGFGFVFIGMKLMTDSVSAFKNYVWFKSLFLVESPTVLFLNGLIITAVIQSSSVATGMMVVLGSIGVLPFEKAVFLILGSNIGTCIPVIFASSGKSAQAKKAALFNLVFNAIGSVAFFLPLIILGEKINGLPLFINRGIGRKIANFHTFFNIAVCLLLLPALKPVCAFTERVYYVFYERDKKRPMQKNKKSDKTANAAARCRDTKKVKLKQKIAKI